MPETPNKTKNLLSAPYGGRCFGVFIDRAIESAAEKTPFLKLKDIAQTLPAFSEKSIAAAIAGFNETKSLTVFLALLFAFEGKPPNELMPALRSLPSDLRCKTIKAIHSVINLELATEIREDEFLILLKRFLPISTSPLWVTQVKFFFSALKSDSPAFLFYVTRLFFLRALAPQFTLTAEDEMLLVKTGLITDTLSVLLPNKIDTFYESETIAVIEIFEPLRSLMKHFLNLRDTPPLVYELLTIQDKFEPRPHLFTTHNFRFSLSTKLNAATLQALILFITRSLARARMNPVEKHLYLIDNTANFHNIEDAPVSCPLGLFIPLEHFIRVNLYSAEILNSLIQAHTVFLWGDFKDAEFNKAIVTRRFTKTLKTSEDKEEKESTYLEEGLVILNRLRGDLSFVSRSIQRFLRAEEKLTKSIEQIEAASVSHDPIEETRLMRLKHEFAVKLEESINYQL